MTLVELAHLLGTRVDVQYTRTNPCFTRYRAQLERVHLLNEGTVEGCFGLGRSDDSAQRSYVEAIRGRDIEHEGHRYSVPATLVP